MNERKKGFPVFWTCLAVFILLMVIFWFWVNKKVNECLIIYENAQPEYKIEKVVSDFESGAIFAQLTFAVPETRFEPEDIYKDLYTERVKGHSFSFEKSNVSYDVNKPVYNIYADHDLVAKVTLNLVSSETLMFILTAQNWEVESIEPLYSQGRESVTVVAPDTYSVFLNAVKMDKREYTDNKRDIEKFKYCAEYTTVPALVEYKVEGMVNPARITIFDNYGNEVDFEVKDSAVYVDDFFETEIDEEIKQMVINNAKDYTNFFSRDLPGCRESVAPIAGMFPEDSYYLVLADNYRRDDMWTYSAHDTPVFANENTFEYIEYTPDLFSVRVYFEKNMILKNGAERCDVMNTTFFYAKVNDKWVIVDMQ